ncbi:hypothetical protein CDFC105_93904 [Clostridioides difficile]|nr:hypothetical protein CDFC105_93904 [Clostridioides difficile]
MSFFFFLMIRRPPRSTLSSSSAASDVYKRQLEGAAMIREIAIKIAKEKGITEQKAWPEACLLYTSPSPRDRQKSRMPSSA